jgi:hypothetical protein
MSDPPKVQPISTSKLRAALLSLTRQMPEDQYHFEHISRLAAQSARSTAIAGAAYLEHGLRAAIIRYLRNTLSDAEQERLFVGDSATLATFADRINIAFALGILGEDIRSDFNVIRQIRNVFAHSVLDVEFDLPTVSAAIGTLRVFKRPDFPQIMKVSGPPKTLFLFTISYYYIRLWIAAPGRTNLEFDLSEWKPSEKWPQAYSQKFV